MPSQLNKPLVGISMRLDYKEDTFYLRRYYSEAIYHAGGLPVHLALIPDADYVESVVSRLDGVLLPGSNSDVDPIRYEQAAHTKLGPVVYERDETDILLLQACEKRRLPVLAICYGLQILNVYKGGTLFQDIESQVESAIQHKQLGQEERPSHTIKLRGTLLPILAGATSVRVNSHHHQGIDELGKDLEPVAETVDGLIEAVVSKTEQFILGVQWHPELGWEKDQFSQAIFKHFVAQAAGR
ncbi:MAG: gamma-glutamyl-gamma-aminobutyrate hydrolase family protein [Acidobacteriota bacterium]|nr:gamma-glutamyl-gamma-aminobutyrate hydrolase family protein [Blastocatellia bacterium]MDW8411463.1 gamma-glutamyl-gamma-aminobutyrate hydrolase family protein [Acidobacteriota bacterium]